MPAIAASRLSDSQKSELVARYRAGEGSAELAAVYGCSANTVSRTVKAALPPREYEQLKQDRARGLKPSLAPLEIPEAPQQLPLTAFDAAAVPDQADQASAIAPAPLVVTDQQISQFALEVPQHLHNSGLIPIQFKIWIGIRPPNWPLKAPTTASWPTQTTSSWPTQTTSS